MIARTELQPRNRRIYVQNCERTTSDSSLRGRTHQEGQQRSVGKGENFQSDFIEAKKNRQGGFLGVSITCWL
jgi:hypothetical protein